MPELDDWDELGPPETREVPHRRQPHTVAIIVAAVVVGGLVLIGLGAWLVLRTPSVAQPPARLGTTEPTTTVTESFVVTGPSGAQTSTVVAESQEDSDSVPTATIGPARLAWRADGALWVSGSTGTDGRLLVSSKSGPFALAPDGRSLAYVDAPSKKLAIADVITGRVTTVGPVVVEPPVWSPTSQWLAYVDSSGGERRVVRVGRDGKARTTLGLGDRPAIAPDGVTYAYISSIGRLMVSTGGAPVHALSVNGRLDDVALMADQVLYALGGGGPADLSIHAARLDGGGDRVLVGSSAEPKAGRYDRLLPSPGGMWLAYAVMGDDGFSRLHAVRLDGANDTLLSKRRDDYPVSWSPDSVKIYFFDGNAIQGQSTQLMSIWPDGHERIVLVSPAGS